MFVYKRLKVIVFSFFFFTAYTAWGNFLPADKMDKADKVRCWAAVRHAEVGGRLTPGDCSYWKGGNWDNDREKNKAPDTEVLIPQPDVANVYLNYKEPPRGVIITKGRQIILAFSGGDKDLEESVGQDGKFVDLSSGTRTGDFVRGELAQGKGRWGPLQLWLSFRDDLLGRGNRIINHMTFCYKDKERVGQSGGELPSPEERRKAFQIMIVGRGNLAGMMAQWAGADFVNALYRGDNGGNNVTVVALDSLDAFDDVARPPVYTVMGGRNSLQTDSRAWGISRLATALSGDDIIRCVTGCRMAQGYKQPAEQRGMEETQRHLPWMGERWSNEYGHQDEAPYVKELGIQEELIEPFLGRIKYKSVKLIAKDRQIIIAFSGGKLLRDFEKWKDRNEKFVGLEGNQGNGYDRGDFNQGKGHWGSLQLWQAVRGQLLGEGNEIRKYMESVGVELGPEAFQIIVTGHGVGGMAAQWAVPDILNTLYRGDNKDSSVVAVTFGAPRVFDAIAAARWNEMVGYDNHLRLVGEKDSLFEYCSAPPFTAFTGVEKKLPQDTISNTTYVVRTVGKAAIGHGFGSFWNGGAYHILTEYEKAVAKHYDRLPESLLSQVFQRFGEAGEVDPERLRSSLELSPSKGGTTSEV